jgi:hypothetical protein
MTHPKKEHRQFKVPMKDPATVGRLGDTRFPLPNSVVDYDQIYYGLGPDSDIDMDQHQGTDIDDTANGTGATGNAAGGGIAGANSM